MLASGRPVIAMANHGTELSKVVGKVGLVVPPEDVDALAETIYISIKIKNKGCHWVLWVDYMQSKIGIVKEC